MFPSVFLLLSILYPEIATHPLDLSFTHSNVLN